MFSYPLLQDAEIFRAVERIDVALEAAADSLMPTTYWFLVYFGPVINQTMFGAYRNKQLFRSVRRKSERSFGSPTESSAEGVFSADELAFLIAIQQAAVAETFPGTPPPKIATFRLYRRTLVECLEAFMEHVGPVYSTALADSKIVSTRYTEMYQECAERPNPEQAMAVAAIERSVRGSNGTYTSVLGVVRHMNEFLRIRAHLVAPYLRKVWSVVRGERRIAQNDQRFLDFFGYGTAGLMTAVNCFDAEKARSFGRFASGWISQSILYHHKVSLNFFTEDPRHIQLRNLVRRTVADLGLRGKPTHVVLDALEQALSHRSDVTRRGLVGYLSADAGFSSLVSLNARVGWDEGAEIGDQIAIEEDQHRIKESSSIERILMRLLSAGVDWADLRVFLSYNKLSGYAAQMHKPDPEALIKMAVAAVTQS